MRQLCLMAVLMILTSQVCVGDIRTDVGDFAINEPDTPLPLELLWTADCRSLTACAASCMGDPNSVSFTVKPAPSGHRQCRCYAYLSISSEKLQDGVSLYHLRRRLETVKQEKPSLSGSPLSTINTPPAANNLSATAIITTEPKILSTVNNAPTTTAIITSTSIINTTSSTGNNMHGAGTSNRADITSAPSMTDTTAATTKNNISETTTSSLTPSASSTTLTTDTTTTINNIPVTTTSSLTPPSASSTTLTTYTTPATSNNIPVTTTSSLTSGASTSGATTTTTLAATTNIPATTTSQTTTTRSTTTALQTVHLSTTTLTTMTTSTMTTASYIVCHVQTASWKGSACFFLGGCPSVPGSTCVLLFCVCIPPYFYNSLTASCVIP